MDYQRPLSEVAGNGFPELSKLVHNFERESTNYWILLKTLVKRGFLCCIMVDNVFDPQTATLVRQH